MRRSVLRAAECAFARGMFLRSGAFATNRAAFDFRNAAFQAAGFEVAFARGTAKSKPAGRMPAFRRGEPAFRRATSTPAAGSPSRSFRTSRRYEKRRGASGAETAYPAANSTSVPAARAIQVLAECNFVSTARGRGKRILWGFERAEVGRALRPRTRAIQE
jgi:hypothetical protein